MQFQQWLTQAAERRPERVALVDSRGETTWAQLEAATASAAGELIRRGAGRGDRVAILLEPGLAFVVALHACLRIGAVATPVDLRLTDAERAAQAFAAVVVVEEPLPTGGDPAPVAPFALDEVATVVHTSGSGGAPVPVELTFGNWLWSALGSAVSLGLRRDERWLCALPLSHVGGLSILMRSAVYATTAVLQERFDAERVVAELADPDGPTAVSLVPTTLARLLDAGLRSPVALRCALVGGAPIPLPLVERALEAGVPVSATYGLTEACSQVATVPPGWPDQSAAPPLFPTGVRIADDGEILVSGPTVAPGSVDDGGWLHTGDLGSVDAAGRLRPAGRKATTIVTGGENVSPEEVEAALETHPAVVEAAVLGTPDPEWGEAVVALVVAAEHTDPDGAQLIAFCRERLAPFKAPKRVAVVDELPHTPSGKLRRAALRWPGA